MSIASEITRLQNAKASLKAAIEGKGVTVPPTTKLDDYENLIASIPSGSDVVESKDIDFIDYDGTLVASYTFAEAQALTSLPQAPDHSQDDVPLIFDEWNWTLAEVKATVHPIVVGANYHTTDGKTHIITAVPAGFVAQMVVYNTNGGTIVINWGDGTQSTITGTNVQTVTHEYEDEYTGDVTIYKASGIYRLGNSNSGSVSSRISLPMDHIYLASNADLSGQFIGLGAARFETISIPKEATLSNTEQYSPFVNTVSLRALVIPRAITTWGGEFGNADGNVWEYISYGAAFMLPTNKQVFRGCTNLKRINPFLTSSLTSYICTYCTKLKEIFWNGNLSKVPDSFAPYCYSLSKIALMGVIQIGNEAFRSCVALKHVDFPSTVTTIGNSAFRLCLNLEEINLPSSVTSIGSYAFNNCVRCKKLTIGNIAMTIGDNNALDGLSALQEIVIPNGWVPNVNLKFSSSYHLSPASLVAFFMNLGETSTTRTITIGSFNLDKLTAGEKTIATNKGYTLA